MCGGQLERRIPTRKEHVQGVLLCVLVSIIWVLSSELSQHLLGSNSELEKKSFLYTYLSTSVFTILLFGFCRISWRVKWYASSSDESSRRQSFNAHDAARIAIIVAPIYFVANWTYNSGLELTSVSSSSTIQNTSCLFAFFISVILRIERFSWSKLFACSLTILGTALITGVDATAGKRGNLRGDLISICSSFLFALYTTVIETKISNNDIIPMMFSFVGLFIFLFAWPLIPILSITGVESFDLIFPSMNSIGIVMANALVGFVVADLLWAKSVVLTSSFVGNTATSLTIPFALVFDWWFKQLRITTVYALGAVLVVAGSVLVSVIKAREDTVKRKAQIISE